MRESHEVFGHEYLVENLYYTIFTPQVMNSITESWDHCSKHDWNRRSFILFRELNYITSCNIFIF